MCIYKIWRYQEGHDLLEHSNQTVSTLPTNMDDEIDSEEGADIREKLIKNNNNQK